MEGTGKIILAHSNLKFIDKFVRAVEECGWEVSVVKSPADIIKKIEVSNSQYDLMGLSLEQMKLRDVSRFVGAMAKHLPSKTRLFAVIAQRARFSQVVLEKIKTLKPVDFISETSRGEEIVFRLGNILFGDNGLRKNYRALVNMVVHCDYMQDFFDAESFTVSKDGIFIKTDRELPKDRKLFLTFKLPTSNRSLATMGNVLYSITDKTPKPRVSPPGCGVYFVDLPSNEREFIDKHIRGNA